MARKVSVAERIEAFAEVFNLYLESRGEDFATEQLDGLLYSVASTLPQPVAKYRLRVIHKAERLRGVIFETPVGTEVALS